MKIALLGAESTGKSQLALALSARLEKAGLAVYRVDEYLREWCDIENRTPNQEEQHHIARTQMARVLAAPAESIVITDTTPLMTAVYSQMVFNDHSLDAYALQQHALFDITLLTGLDLAWVSDGLQRVGEHVREPVDRKIRQLLTQANLPFQVVYGSGEQRLKNALFCVARQAPLLAKQQERPEQPIRWSGPCETCGDGNCEHRLFTKLVKG